MNIDGILAFPEPMVLRPIDLREWELMADYVIPAFGFSVRIPAGFRTDLASVPHFIWTLIGATDLGRAAPLGHDFLYVNGGFACGLVEPLRRVRVDRLFRVLMQMEQVIGWRRWCAWAAVRLFGWACWHKADERMDYQRAKGRGSDDCSETRPDLAVVHRPRPRLPVPDHPEPGRRRH